MCKIKQKIVGNNNSFYASISPSRIARIKLAKMKYVLSSVHKGNTIKQHGVKWLCENYYT